MVKLRGCHTTTPPPAPPNTQPKQQKSNLLGRHIQGRFKCLLGTLLYISFNFLGLFLDLPHMPTFYFLCQTLELWLAAKGPVNGPEHCVVLLLSSTCLPNLVYSVSI